MKRIRGETKYLLLFSVMLLAVLSFTLSSCGSGGSGGGGGAPSGPPFIAAELDSFPTGSIPTGFNSGATVAVLNDSSGASITTATVIMNGVTLTYDVTKQYYEGNVVVAPGGAVTLSVTAGGRTNTASATQFTSYPTISAPVSGATWNSSIANTVTWSGGAPTTNAVYGLGVLDAADPNSPLIWPLDHFVQDVPIGATSNSIPAASITAGNRLVIVGIATSGVVIPNAAPGSSLVIGGFNYVPITVTGMPVTSRTSGTTNTLSGVAWSGTKFVAVGDVGTILTSPDGVTWTSRTSGTTNILRGVVWSGTKFVAVGDVDTILTSPDGITWTSRTSGTGYDLNGVAWSGTQFVVVGSFAFNSSGIIVTSSDGINWGQQHENPQTSGPFDGLSGVTWSGAQFVAVGVHIFTSPGGLDPGVLWTQETSGTTNTLSGVAWSGTKFVAVGDVGTILTSPDGVTWTSRTSGTTNTLSGVAWSGTKFVAVGDVGTILASPDGVTWTLQASGTANTLYGVAWSGTEFIIIGANGTILTSP